MMKNVKTSMAFYQRHFLHLRERLELICGAVKIERGPSGPSPFSCSEAEAVPGEVSSQPWRGRRDCRDPGGALSRWGRRHRGGGDAGPGAESRPLCREQVPADPEGACPCDMSRTAEPPPLLLIMRLRELLC